MDNPTIEIVITERDGKGNPTGKSYGKAFDTGGAAAAWYDRQRGHNIDHEIANRHSGVIRHKKGS